MLLTVLAGGNEPGESWNCCPGNNLQVCDEGKNRVNISRERQEAQAILREFGCRLEQSAGMLASKVSNLLNNSRVLHCKSGEILFSAGDTLEDLYFVFSGLVRYYYVTPDGKEFNKNFVSSGGVATSLSAFLEARPAPFFIEALEPTILIAAPINFVRDLVARDNDWERLVSRFVRTLALQKEQREASFLMNTAEQRYEMFLQDYREIAGRLPQYHIASYVGITPVALSRIRARRTGRETS